MVHQQAHRTTFVKIRGSLFEERIDGEFEIELFNLKLGERLCKSSFRTDGLECVIVGFSAAGLKKFTFLVVFGSPASSSSPSEPSSSPVSAAGHHQTHLALEDIGKSSLPLPPAKPLNNFPVSVATLSTLDVHIFTHPSNVQLAF